MSLVCMFFIHSLTNSRFLLVSFTSDLISYQFSCYCFISVLWARLLSNSTNRYVILEAVLMRPGVNCPLWGQTQNSGTGSETNPSESASVQKPEDHLFVLVSCRWR